MRIVSIVCAVLIFSVTAAYSAPVGSTATPALLKSSMISKYDEEAVVGIIGSFESDITNDRKLKNQLGKTDIRFFSGKIGLVFANRLLIYGLGGTARIEEKFKDKGSVIKFDSNTDMGWGVGATVVLFEKQLFDLDSSILRIGVDGKVRDTKLELDKIRVDGVLYEGLPSKDVTSWNINYSDWQIAGAVSWQWKRLIPYAGVKFSDATGELSATVLGTEYRHDIGAEEKLGVFLGADYIIKDPITETDAISVNIEYRLLDEQALSLAFAVRF